MQRTQMRSSYLEWAKLYSDAKYNLSSSGMLSYPMSGLPVDFSTLEINGPTIYGYEPLLQRIAAYNGVPQECVFSALGTSGANFMAFAAVLEHGDEMLIEDPGYELMSSTALYLGAEVKTFPRRFENQYRIDPEEVRRRITAKTRLIAVTNLHNPSSVMVDTATLHALGEIALECGAHVLVDEVYLEAVFDREVETSFKLGPQFMVTSSLTKAFGLSGLRCGWVLASPGLCDRMWHLNDLYIGTPPHPPEQLSVVAFDNLDRVKERAKKILETNRPKVKAFLESRDDLEYVWPGVGTTVFPKLLRGSVEEFCEVLRKHESSVVPGSYFNAPQHFRIGLAGDPEITEVALERLGAALDEFRSIAG